jgi:hypothetical protein
MLGDSAVSVRKLCLGGHRERPLAHPVLSVTASIICRRMAGERELPGERCWWLPPWRSRPFPVGWTLI